MHKVIIYDKLNLGLIIDFYWSYLSLQQEYYLEIERYNR